MNSSQRATWVDAQNRTWRIERVTDRWQLSRYVSATDSWQRIGSYPSKSAAIDAAYSPDER
jgi:hypothetical protein